MKWNTYAQIWKCMDYYNCVQLKTEPHLNNREHEHPLVLYKKLTCLQEVCYICVLEFQILWQALVEIEDHYFDRIATFEAPYYGTYIKDGGHYTLNGLIRYLHIYEPCMSSALNRSSVVQRFKPSDAIKICDRLTFDFYMGLSYLCLEYTRLSHSCSTYSWKIQ